MSNSEREEVKEFCAWIWNSKSESVAKARYKLALRSIHPKSKSSLNRLKHAATYFSRIQK